MKIAFNGIGCGWGNNGGTQTVFRTAMGLSRLGHDVEVWSDSDNQMTWFPLEDGVVYKKCSLNDATDVDVLFASGVRTVKETCKFKRKKIAVNWVRAIETWAMSDENLIEVYSQPTLLWVNSTWMKKWLKDNVGREDVDVVYPGLPLDQFYDTGDRLGNRVTVGCLYSLKARKNWKLFVDVRNRMRKSGVDFRFLSFGAEDWKNWRSVVDLYEKNPSFDVKRKMYSMCDIWFAPTYSEGLHIPPMEAALCGAAVVGNAILSAGIEDSCFHEKTSLLFETPDDAYDCVMRLAEDNELRKKLQTNHEEFIRKNIGSVDDNVKKIESLLVVRLEEAILNPVVYEETVAEPKKEKVLSKEERKALPKRGKIISHVKSGKPRRIGE